MPSLTDLDAVDPRAGRRAAAPGAAGATSAGRYEIIAGERRWRAAQRAGLTEIPVHRARCRRPHRARARHHRERPARRPQPGRRGAGLPAADRRARLHAGRSRPGHRQEPQPCRQHAAAAEAAGCRSATCWSTARCRPAMPARWSRRRTRRGWPSASSRTACRCARPRPGAAAGRWQAAPRDQSAPAAEGCRHAGAGKAAVGRDRA